VAQLVVASLDKALLTPHNDVIQPIFGIKEGDNVSMVQSQHQMSFTKFMPPSHNMFPTHVNGHCRIICASTKLSSLLRIQVQLVRFH
jgi:hypothetical protein